MALGVEAHAGASREVQSLTAQRGYGHGRVGIEQVNFTDLTVGFAESGYAEQQYLTFYF